MAVEGFLTPRSLQGSLWKKETFHFCSSLLSSLPSKMSPLLHLSSSFSPQILLPVHHCPFSLPKPKIQGDSPICDMPISLSTSSYNEITLVGLTLTLDLPNPAPLIVSHLDEDLRSIPTSQALRPSTHMHSYTHLCLLRVQSHFLKQCLLSPAQLWSWLNLFMLDSESLPMLMGFSRLKTAQNTSHMKTPPMMLDPYRSHFPPGANAHKVVLHSHSAPLSSCKLLYLHQPQPQYILLLHASRGQENPLHTYNFVCYHHQSLPSTRRSSKVRIKRLVTLT